MDQIPIPIAFELFLEDAQELIEILEKNGFDALADDVHKQVFEFLSNP